MTGDVDAVILAAGRGERLGLGPKAWLVLGGRTLLERAVSTMRLVAAHVVVGVAHEDVARARALCRGDAEVVAGGATHRETMLATLRAGRAPLVVIHDVAHPFVTAALARDVIARAREHGAAVAAVRSTSSAYHEPGGASRARLRPGEVWLVRRPFAARRDPFAGAMETSRDEDGLSTILARAGVRTEIVPAAAWNIKVTGADDWPLAEAIESGLRPV